MQHTPRLLHFALLGALLASCSPPPPPIQPGAVDGVDEAVLELVQGAISKVEEDPRNADFRVELALIYEANELWHEAAQAWGQALPMVQQSKGGEELPIRGVGSYGVGVYHQALCTRQAGEVKEAAALLERAVELAPGLPAAHHELVEAHLEVGELKEAETHFMSASRLSPISTDPIVGLALVCLGRDEFVEAEAWGRKALAVEPSLKRAHYALGLALRGQGKLDEAERELTLGLGADARNLSDPLVASLQELKTGYHARISEAVKYVNAGNPAKAVQVLEPIVEQHPDDEALLNNLAVAYTHLRQHAKARAVLLKLIEIEPTSFAAYINLAAAELELNLEAEALKHAEAAVRYAPDVAKTRFVRARVFMRYERWSEAYADLRKAVQIQGDDPINHFLLGEACQKLMRHEEAVRAYEAVLRLDNNLRYVWIELGESAAAYGDFQKASEAHEKAIAVHGAADPRVRALGQAISER